MTIEVREWGRGVTYENTAEFRATMDRWAKAAARRRWKLQHRTNRVIRRAFPRA